MKGSVDNWYEGLTLEVEMLNGAYNPDDKPASLYVRVILVDPITRVRKYQKAVKISFKEEDLLE